MAREIKQWITVNHIHIPIFEGETAKDAVKRLKEGGKKGKDSRPSTEESIKKKKQAVVDATKEVNKAHRAFKEQHSAANAENYTKAKDKQYEATQAYKKEQSKPKFMGAHFKKKEKHSNYKVEESQKAFHIENNRKALKQYQDWEAQKKQELEDYLESSEYKRGHYSWDDKEAKNKVEAKKKELEDAIKKNREEAYKMARKLQEDGALPRYSKDREDGTFGQGVILDSTVTADPRYETLSNSLKYNKYQAKEMLRHIMYAEEEGKNSFSTMVYDFMGGDKYSYASRSTAYKQKPGKEGYTNFGEFLRDYKKAMKEVGWKVTTSENRDDHRRGYHTARGGWESASHSSARYLTFEKIPEKAVKPKTTPTPKPTTPTPTTDTLNGKAIKSEMNSLYTLTGGKRDLGDAHVSRINNFIKDYNENPDKYAAYKGAVNRVKKYINENDAEGKRFEKFKEKTWQDKDAEVKAKQIANAEAQKADRSHVWTQEDKERWEVREAFARGEISPEEAKAYGFTDEQLKAVTEMGRREALQRVVDGRNKGAYIDPMGNFNTAKSRSKYEINHNEDFRNMSQDSARAELREMREKKAEKVVDFGNGEAIKKRNESIIEYNGVKMPRKDADDIDYLKKELSFLSERAAHLKVHMGKTLSEKELKEREDLQNQLRKYKKKYPNISIGRYLPGGK